MVMSTATEMRDLYIAAEKAVLRNQSYSLNGRSLTRANLPDIVAGRKEWEEKVAAENSSSQGGSSLYSVADFR